MEEYISTKPCSGISKWSVWMKTHSCQYGIKVLYIAIDVWMVVQNLCKWCKQRENGPCYTLAAAEYK